MKKNAVDDNQHKRHSWLKRLLTTLRREPKNQDQLKTLLRRAKDQHVLSSEMLSMLERMLQISDIQVREVMVPKGQLVVVEKGQQLNELLPLIIESGHSRFPVIDTTRDHIIGILLAKDLLTYCFDKNPVTFEVTDMMRPANFTAQSKRLDILLHEFRLKHNHMAIVLDEYGHVAGLITIEDILEQVVGDIEDEYDIDDEEDQIKKMNDASYVIKAATTINEFNAYFKENISDEDVETIGGWVLKSFNHLPKRGESVKIGPWRFKVLNCDNRRIYLLEMRPIKFKKKED